MPTLRGSLGSWEVEHLHYWKERGVLPAPSPFPLVDQNTKIATIGSCFAEHIVRVLYDRGFNIAMHPAGLWYNTFSIAQEFAHIFEPSPYEKEPLWQTDSGLWVHPFKSYHRQLLSKDELLSWSDAIDTQARKLFGEAEVIVITLGLTEVWRSTVTNNVFIQLPPPDIHRRGLAKFTPTTFSENFANMEKIYALIRRHSDAQIIVTVSPVPLYATFRNLDVRVANNISKSTLRTVVAEFVSTHEDVYYFHSYEIVAAVDFPGMFMKDDKRHVRDEGVELIMDEFLRTYGNPSLKVKPRDVSWLEQLPEPKGKIHRNQLAKKVYRRLRRKVSKLLGKAL